MARGSQNPSGAQTDAASRRRRAGSLCVSIARCKRPGTFWISFLRLAKANPRAASLRGPNWLLRSSVPTVIAMGSRSTRLANSSSASRCRSVVAVPRYFLKTSSASSGLKASTCRTSSACTLGSPMRRDVYRMETGVPGKMLINSPAVRAPASSQTSSRMSSASRSLSQVFMA